MTITRKFTRNNVNVRRLSFNSKTCTLFLVNTAGGANECLRRQAFASAQLARDAWSEWQGQLEGGGFERGKTSCDWA